MLHKKSFLHDDNIILIPTRGEKQDFTHQFTFFIYYSHQDQLKYSRITRIHQVHQTLPREQD